MADISGVVAVAVALPRSAWWDGVPARRLAAAFIDLTLAGMATGVTAQVALRLGGAVGSPMPLPLLVGLAAVVTAVPLAWFVVGEAAVGTTVGKHLVGLAVRSSDGGRPGWRRSAFRSSLRLSPLAWAALVRSGVCGAEPWQDRWSATQVVRQSTEVALFPARHPARPVGQSQAAAAARPPTGPAGAERPLRLVAPPTPPDAGSGPAPTRPAPPVFTHPRRPGRRSGTGRLRSGPRPLTLVATATATATATAHPGDPSPPSPTAEPPAAPCRCHDVPRLTGEAAVRYACGHLLAVRRWPRAGSFALVCPTTRVAWLAHDEWADRSGEATLIRLAPLPDPVHERLGARPGQPLR